VFFKSIYYAKNTIDTTINFLSNHAIEHKMAAFSYHISRVYSLPLTPEKKIKIGNDYTNDQKQQLSTKSSTETKPTNTTQNHPCSIGSNRREEKCWTTFKYYSPQIKKITNLFKRINICIVFRNTKILQHNNSQNSKHHTKQQNMTKAVSINLHATIAVNHKSDKQAVA